ncbi:MAG: hypothetical protein IIB56_17045 [Planctomycetes bacterium]|nr:hypothetical protein [Planctomycetota bacterium]MCH8118521.1 hypothetical protein [Planctomycetota bacterium]
MVCIGHPTSDISTIDRHYYDDGQIHFDINKIIFREIFLWNFCLVEYIKLETVIARGVKYVTENHNKIPVKYVFGLERPGRSEPSFTTVP